MTKEPWEGDERCSKPGCPFSEIEGLGFCLHHVPGEDLEEAEQVTGLRRCRKCDYLATDNSDPPLCPAHVQENISPPPELHRASTAFIESDMGKQLADIMAEHGARLMDPPARPGTLEALAQLEAEMSEFRQILREQIACLQISRWRYAHHRVGEQIRTELMLYERAVERHAKLLVSMARLDIKRHHARLDKALIDVLLTKFGLALEASGLDIEGQAKAREYLGAALQEIE